MSTWKTSEVSTGEASAIASSSASSSETLASAQISSSKTVATESHTARGLRGFCAGAVGGAVTTTILSPIDVARSRIMVQVGGEEEALEAFHLGIGMLSQPSE